MKRTGIVLAALAALLSVSRAEPLTLAADLAGTAEETLNERAKYVYTYAYPQAEPSDESAEAINAFYQYRVDDTLNFEVPMNADYYRGQDPEKDVTVDVSYRVTCNSDAFFSILITTRQDGLTTCAGHTFSRTDVRAGSTVALPYLLGLLETGEKDTWLQDRQTARADALVREMVWERLQETDGAELYDGLDRESLEYGFFPEEDFYLDETGNPVFYLEPGFAKDGGEPLLFPISIAEILDEM